MGKIFVLKYFRGLGATTKIYYHENILPRKFRKKVSPLSPVNCPCAAGIAVEPFWPCSAVLRLHIRRLYNVLLFVVKNISCDKFSWFEPRKYFNNENFPNYGYD